MDELLHLRERERELIELYEYLIDNEKSIYCGQSLTDIEAELYDITDQLKYFD